MSGPNYIDVLLELAASGAIRPGVVNVATVFHDDGCDVFGGKLCNCEPSIRHVAIDLPKETSPCDR